MGGSSGFVSPTRSLCANVSTRAPTARPVASPAARSACLAPGHGSEACCASSAASSWATLPGKNELSTALSEREIRVQANRVDPGRWRRLCEVGRELVPTNRCASVPELDCGESHARVGSHGLVGRVWAVDTAGRRNEHGRAEQEHTLEHGVCLSEKVDQRDLRADRAAVDQNRHVTGNTTSTVVSAATVTVRGLGGLTAQVAAGAATSTLTLIG